MSLALPRTIGRSFSSIGPVTRSSTDILSLECMNSSAGVVIVTSSVIEEFLKVKVSSIDGGADHGTTRGTRKNRRACEHG